MQELTEEWVFKAENDFTVAHLAMRLEHDEPPVVDSVCFHCQQCAEKYLKAFLQEHEVRFEPRHPLIPLLESCLTLDPDFERLHPDLMGLDGYAVAARYPGIVLNDEMAERALAAAGRIRAFVRIKLGFDQPPERERDRE